MIFVTILEGYSASFRERTIIDVYEEAEASVKEKLEFPVLMIGERSSILRSRSRRIRKLISSHASKKVALVCIGKSFGGKQIIDKVINRLPEKEVWSQFNSTYIITVDPCWPLPFNWAPNLNREVLWVNKSSARIENIYLATSKKKQAGSLVGANVQDYDRHHNSRVTAPYTHFSIIAHPMVKEKICKVLLEANQSLQEKG